MIMLNEKGEIAIDGEGFMESCDFNTYIAKEYACEFSFLRQINEYMYKIYDLILLQNTDEIGCFFAVTYNKIHKNMQMIIIAASRGLNEQVRILLRSMLDKLMIMQAVCNDNDNYDKWIKHQQYEMYRLVKDIKKGEPGLEALKERYSNNDFLPKGKYISQKEWAKLAGMEEEYNVVYRLFSGNVHYSVSSLEAELLVRNGLPHIMDIGPQYSDTKKLLITLATDALRALWIIITYFKIDDTEYKKIAVILEKMQSDILSDSI